MIKIRLTRHGKKGKPIYKIVAIEKNNRREGVALDVLGYWNPSKGEININKEKFKNWLTRGATKSRAVDQLLNK